MAERSQIPTLLRLVDDESPVVRQEIAGVFAAFDDLRHELATLEPPPTSLQRIHLQRLMDEWHHGRQRLLERWPHWRRQPDDLGRLEAGLSLVADFQTEYLHPDPLGQVLDELAGSYSAAHPQPAARSLSDYLFKAGRLQGDTERYDHPFNSNLVDVVLSGSGIPISLACVFILVGKRTGVTVEACNYPGHFLARVPAAGGAFYVDCFAEGRWLDSSLTPELRGRVPLHQLDEVLSAHTSAEEVMARVLRNLVNAYQQQEAPALSNLFLFLLKGLETDHRGPLPQLPEFAPGDLVRHREAPFRGVIVDYDLEFVSGPAGFRAPFEERGQPWYRVLVDNTRVVSYSAQSHLRPDDGGGEVRHPFVNYFFVRYEGGRYVRNNLPWPKDS